jgi:hypothetical protein
MKPDFQATIKALEQLLIFTTSLERQQTTLQTPQAAFLRICFILALTSREADAAWLADLKSAEACNTLAISQATLKDHWRHISKKLKTDTPNARRILSTIKQVFVEELDLHIIEIDQDT